MKIDDIEIPIQSKEIVSANILTAEAGTTGFRGGDSGHGGRTVISLRNDASTDLRCEVDGKTFEDVTEIKIIVGGDSELSTLIESLEFMVQTLKNQSA
jgi:hypothetical protein